jgi:hypothetical protein
MTNFLACLILCSVLFIGCGSSYRVTQTGRGADLSTSALNEIVRDKAVVVTLWTDAEVPAEQFQCHRDSASWRGRRDAAVVKVPVSQIRSLTTEPDRLQGGLLGLVAGTFLGATLGLIVDSGPESTGTGLMGARLGVVMGVFGGGLLGTVTGVASSQACEYRFSSEQKTQ